MGEFFSDTLAWMEQVSPLWAYVAILVIAYGENIVPPIPGDMVVVFGGYLVGIGKLNFLVVVLLSTIGGALGFMTMYLIGRRIGEAVLDPDRLTWLPKHRIEKVRNWLGRWGYGVVAANRFLSGARSIISITVGMAHTDPLKTAGYATLSAAVWTCLIAYGGYQLGDNWPLVAQYLRAYGKFILLALGLVVVFFAARYFMRRYRRGSRAGE